MDEVDKIILVSLKDAGIRLKPESKTLKSFSFEEIVGMVVSCLKIIYPEMKFTEFPPSLPGTMSARYQMSSRLAQLTTELGYKGDVGYQTFMYQNTKNIRHVLEFLVERLPKKNTFHVTDDTRDAKTSIKQQISQELKRMLTASDEEHSGMCSNPFISQGLETGTVLPNQKLDCEPIEWRNFVVDKLPVIYEQLPDNRLLLPSLISLNLNGMIRPNKPKTTNIEANSRDAVNYRTSDVSFERNSIPQPELHINVPSSENEVSLVFAEKKKSQNVTMSDEELIEKTEDEKNIKEWQDKIDDYRLQISSLSTELQNLVTKNENVRQKLRENLVVQNSLEQSLQLLPNSENNIVKLQAANEKSVAKFHKMENQWTQHKNVLEEKRSNLKKKYDVATNDKNVLLRNIAKKRKELLDTVELISQRMTIEKRLQHIDSIKGIPRNEYVSRILDIINSLKKQDHHIKEILKDLRDVQKEMNSLTEKLGRSFTMAEQLITVNSPTDEFSKETHRLLMMIHKDISETVGMVKEIGDYSREIKDLEDQLADCSNSFTLNALNEVVTDLKRLRNENERLTNEVKLLKNEINSKKHGDSFSQNHSNCTESERKTAEANDTVSKHIRLKLTPHVGDHPLA